MAVGLRDRDHKCYIIIMIPQHLPFIYLIATCSLNYKAGQFLEEVAREIQLLTLHRDY